MESNHTHWHSLINLDQIISDTKCGQNLVRFQWLSFIIVIYYYISQRQSTPANAQIITNHWARFTFKLTADNSYPSICIGTIVAFWTTCELINSSNEHSSWNPFECVAVDTVCHFDKTELFRIEFGAANEQCTWIRFSRMSDEKSESAHEFEFSLCSASVGHKRIVLGLNENSI